MNNFKVTYIETNHGFVPQINIDGQIRKVPLLVSQNDIKSIEKKMNDLSTKKIDNVIAYSTIVGAMLLSMKTTG